MGPSHLARDPSSHPLFQNVHRQRTGVEELVVERPDVELWTESGARLIAESQERQLPDLVSQRLCRPRNVPVGLRLQPGFVLARVVVEVLDDLLTGPVLVVNSGVHNEADCAEHLVVEASVVDVRILVESDFLPQSLGVKSPAFNVCSVARLLTEWRKRRQLLRDRDLHVVSRHAFVVRRRLVVDYKLVGEVVGVDEDVARSRAVGRALVVRRRCFLLAEGFDGKDFQLGFG